MIRIVKLCKETEIAPSSLLELQKSGLFWKSRKDIYIFSAHSPQFETKQGRRPYTTQVNKCGNGFRADFIFSIVLSLSVAHFRSLVLHWSLQAGLHGPIIPACVYKDLRQWIFQLSEENWQPSVPWDCSAMRRRARSNPNETALVPHFIP